VKAWDVLWRERLQRSGSAGFASTLLDKVKLSESLKSVLF